MKFRLYWAFIVLALGMIALSFLIPAENVFEPGAVLKDNGKAVLDEFDSVIKLVTGLDSLLLAAAAAITVKGRDWSPRWTSIDSVLILLTFMAAAVSYYGVYLCEIRLLSMAQAGGILATETLLLWAVRLQHWGIIVGVSLLGIVFCRMLEGRTSETTP